MPAKLLTESNTTDVDVPADQHTHKTAFLVLVGHNGEYSVQPNINIPVIPERQPSMIDVDSALTALCEDFRAQKLANHILFQMEQKARAAQEAMQNQAIMQQMGNYPR